MKGGVVWHVPIANLTVAYVVTFVPAGMVALAPTAEVPEPTTLVVVKLQQMRN